MVGTKRASHTEHQCLYRYVITALMFIYAGIHKRWSLMHQCQILKDNIQMYIKEEKLVK